MLSKKSNHSKLVEQFIDSQLSLANKNELVFFYQIPTTSREYCMATYRLYWFKQILMLRDIVIVRMFFKKEFWILRYTFAFIFDLVSIPVARENMVFREVVQIQNHTAIAIWMLTTGNADHTVWKVFPVCETTFNGVLLQLSIVLFMVSAQNVNFLLQKREMLWWLIYFVFQLIALFLK